MSAGTGSSIETVYVSLLDEGTSVMRPVTAVALAEMVFQLVAPPDYDPETENWEFKPGSVVRCSLERRDGEQVFVARSLWSGSTRV